MKNIKLFYQNYKKEIKRTISGITALATIMSVLPFAEVKPQIDEVVTKIVTATAEEATFAYSDADAKKISLYIDNSTTNSFKAYAQKYKDDSGFAALHKEDKISIVFGSTSNVDLTGFVGLGTSATPFAGSIEIPSGNNLILRMDAPLFTCVYDTVPVYGSNPNDPARIARFYANAVTDKTTPILAREVKKNTNTAIAKATWNVSLMPYTDETTYLSEFGGFIGTMEGGAILTVKADMTKSNAEADPDVDINSSGTENIGLCCKTMGDGAELNFTLTGDRDIKSVSASGGNAGGLVGSMGAGAKLNYTQTIRTTPFIKSKCTIQTTSGKYAGGLVGENKGTVNIVMPGSTQYVIDQTLSASEGAGGLFGYYAPDGTVASFITGVFDINCQVEDAESCGGLFGKMESSYNMTLRSAAESSGQSGSSGNGNATLSENASPISAAAPEEVAAEETVATENDEIFTESHTASETENETDATVAEVSEAEEVSTETSESETLQEAVIQEDVVADTTALAESTDATEMTETTSLENSFTETFTNTDTVLSENATVFEEETTNPNTITLTDNPIILSGEGEPNLNIVSKNTTGTDNYGGLIGTYMASSSAIKLEINKLKAKVEANTLKNYGGAIGLIDETNPAYVYFENFDLVEVKNADKSQSEPAAEVTFGGLVAKGTKAFLDVNGAKINSSKGTDTGSYRGGGLVGDLGDGVLRMAGTIDLSGTTTVNGAQIVNLRDDALVFAEDMTAAKLIRQSPAVEFDDIGSWGEVLRFISGTTTTSNSVTTKTESLSENTVLTVNETAHSIEVGTPVLEIATAADFAKTALRFQIETGGDYRQSVCYI